MRDDSSREQYRFYFNQYNVPVRCVVCGGNMIFKGVGEYECERCHALDYDDYGKVRNYVEEHRGATTAEISAATGVGQREINEMVKEERFEVTADSRTFLKCEGCGVSIRIGRFCPTCQKLSDAALARKRKKEERKQISGFSTEIPRGEDGAKRFERSGE